MGSLRNIKKQKEKISQCEIWSDVVNKVMCRSKHTCSRLCIGCIGLVTEPYGHCDWYQPKAGFIEGSN
jgi:hypothetical protein